MPNLRTVKQFNLLLVLVFCLLPSLWLNAEKLPPVTNASQVHRLTASEADRSYPVHITATVTFRSTFFRAHQEALFLQDNSGSAFAWLPLDQTWPAGPPVAGNTVEVDGVSAAGEFAPVILASRVRVVSKEIVLPIAKPITVTELATGLHDCEWVQIEGIVRSVYYNVSTVTLELATSDGLIGAVTTLVPNVNYRHLVDAKIRIKAASAAEFNKKRQLTGTRLYFSDPSYLSVLKAAPLAPFEAPLRDIDELAQFTSAAGAGHRTHVRGVVTLRWPGRLICIQNGEKSLCAKSFEAGDAKVGDLVDAIGFVALDGYRPFLENAVFERRSPGPVVKPSSITADQGLDGDQDAKLVQMDGVVIGREIAWNSVALMLSDGRRVFPIALAPDADQAGLNATPNGTLVRATGICAVEMDTQETRRGRGVATTKGFRILLRTPGDIEILKKAPYWSAGRVFILLAVALTVTAAVLGWVVVLRKRVDQRTSALRDSEERFRYLAEHDALTGLPTRRVLHKRLESALELARSSAGKLSLLMIDLDKFKSINDTFGHQVGDNVLCITFARLLAAVRSTDIVARLGGDEFMILLENLDSATQAEEISARIVASVSSSMFIGDREHLISASIGIYHVADPHIDVDSLLQSVDTALYSAKSEGRNRFEVFSSDLGIASLRAAQVRTSLPYALVRNEFQLNYQPILDLNSNIIMGFEALLRWRSGELGIVSPDEFIPVAEETGLIVQIGEWVLEEGCKEIKAIELQLDRHVSLSVNLSAKQFLHKGLVLYIGELLARHQRAAHELTLEITERTLMSDGTKTKEAMNGLRALGVKFAIDDFGTGYSSLSYITHLNVDWIKIDKSLISDCATDTRSCAVLRTIISLAQDLSMQVVAEGIETMDQLAFLKEKQCHFGQGYFINRPKPASDLLAACALIENEGTSVTSSGAVLPALQPAW